MRYYTVYIVAIILMLACSTANLDCRYSLNDFLSADPLPSWERQTEGFLATSDPDLHRFITSAKRDSVEFFDRELFLKQLGSRSRDSLFYSKLYILEFNRSGEKNIMQKSVILQCGPTSDILNFIRTPSGWIQGYSPKVKSEVVNNLLKEFNSTNSGEEQYWGYEFGDLYAIAEITDSIQDLKVYKSMNKRQFEIVSQLTSLNKTTK